MLDIASNVRPLDPLDAEIQKKFAYQKFFSKVFFEMMSLVLLPDYILHKLALRLLLNIEETFS